jgi:hypothetical protein
MNKVFYCTDHDGHYPVGVASIIVAPNEASAREALKATLNDMGLKGNNPFTLQELDTSKNRVVVLADGNY